jgi:benzoate-CoA ligase
VFSGFIVQLELFCIRTDSPSNQGLEETNMPEHTPAPPAQFNFAAHLIAANAGRHNKTALIDDVGSLTYGELAEQIKSTAAGLLSAGLRREERVLLLMHDCTDWVVSFL